MATCEATMFDRVAHTPSASETTAADVSSHDVSIPSINTQQLRRLFSRPLFR
jgi:hypothetical protein